MALDSHVLSNCFQKITPCDTASRHFFITVQIQHVYDCPVKSVFQFVLWFVTIITANLCHRLPLCLGEHKLDDAHEHRRQVKGARGGNRPPDKI